MRALAAVLVLSSIACVSAKAPTPRATVDADLPTHVVRLENGLTLVMQPDPAMPQVGVEVWIRGGSREEAKGQHGVAHLFEHNLPSSGRFLGNETNRAIRSASARASGAGTQPDFLRFYSVAAPEGLEAHLGALADRLESDPEKFIDESVRRDQDIVVSELRRNMGLEWDVDVLAHLSRGTFGPDHPYGHAVSGSEADVRAANAKLMREWHARYAGAANALVFVVGSFDRTEAETMVRRHFGSIAPGPAFHRATDWVPRVQPHHEIVEKDVQRGTVYLRWPIPGWGTTDAADLELVARILDHRLASHEADAEVETWELAGAFTVKGTFRDAGEARAVEDLLRSETAHLVANGPTEEELRSAQAASETEFVRALQRPVWRGSRADVIGFGLMFRGDPAHYRKQLARMRAGTAAALRRTAGMWLASDAYTLLVMPRGARAAAAPVDRSAAITKVEPHAVAFPLIRTATLANGLRAMLVERPALPLAQLTLVFDGSGAAAETALETLMQLPAGAGTTRLADALSAVGAEVRTDVTRDLATVSISVLTAHADEALGLLARALAGPIPAEVVSEANARVGQRLSAQSAPQLRRRALTCIVAACDAPATPAITNDDVQRFFSRTHAIIASGALTAMPPVAATLPHLDGSAKSAPPAHPDRERFVVIDDPTATQSHILLAQVLPSSVASDPLAAQLVVAHALRSRLMDNLRSAKGWSYEVYPFGVELQRGGAIATFNIPVQADKTAESIAEVRKEIARLQSESVPAQFLASVRGYLEASLTAGLMSLDALNAQILEVVRNDLPANYYSDALERVRRYTPADVTGVAQSLLTPGRLIWVIAGNRSLIEAELRDLGVTDAEVVTPK